MFTEPLAGWRQVSVRPTKTKADWERIRAIRVLGGRGRTPQTFVHVAGLFAAALLGCAVGALLSTPFSASPGLDQPFGEHGRDSGRSLPTTQDRTPPVVSSDELPRGSRGIHALPPGQGSPNATRASVRQKQEPRERAFRLPDPVPNR